MIYFQRLNCKSVSCQCPFFGDGCFADTLPPCGRDCVCDITTTMLWMYM